MARHLDGAAIEDDLARREIDPHRADLDALGGDELAPSPLAYAALIMFSRSVIMSFATLTILAAAP